MVITQDALVLNNLSDKKLIIIPVDSVNEEDSRVKCRSILDFQSIDKLRAFTLLKKPPNFSILSVGEDICNIHFKQCVSMEFHTPTTTGELFELTIIIKY